MKTVKRAIIFFLLLFVTCATWGWFSIWRSPKHFTLTQECPDNQSILTMPQYGALVDTHARPFVVTSPELTVFGAEHTRDPNDSQIEHIQTEWERLEPTVALVEGRLGFLIPYAMNPVERFGESGAVAALAKSDGADLYSWELPRSDLITELLKSFTAEQVALHQILTPYFSGYRFGPPKDPVEFVESFIHRAQYPGLDNCITSIEDIDRIWVRDFADDKDWPEVSDQFGLPGYLAQISDEANLIRNRHLVCAIEELLTHGERVLVICGSSHAVCIEPAFR